MDSFEKASVRSTRAFRLAQWKPRPVYGSEAVEVFLWP
jgi:hypothetical protein